MSPTLGCAPNIALQLCSLFISSSLQKRMSSAAFLIAASFVKTSSCNDWISSRSSGRAGLPSYKFVISSNLSCNNQYLFSISTDAFQNSPYSSFISEVYSDINCSICRLRPACSLASFSRYYYSIVQVNSLWSATHFSIVRFASATLSFISETSSSLIRILLAKSDTSDSSQAIICFKLSISLCSSDSASFKLFTTIQ